MQIELNKPKSIFQILREGFNLYLKKFVPYTMVMIYPVMAHVLGIPLSIAPSYLVPDFFPIESIQKYTVLIAALTFLLAIPGFALFISGFWKYLIAMVSLNRYTKGIIEKDDAVSLKACSDYVVNRKKNYLLLLFLMMLIWIVGIIIPLIPLILNALIGPMVSLVLFFILSAISMALLLCVSVFLCLGYQVFAFEELGPVDIIKRSFYLIEKNFIRTLFLLVVLYIITGFIAPGIIHIILESTGLINLLAIPFSWLSDNFMDSIFHASILYPGTFFGDINNYLGFIAPNFAKSLALSTVYGVVTAGMLPFGTACFTLLYFDILTRKEHQVT